MTRSPRLLLAFSVVGGLALVSCSAAEDPRVAELESQIARLEESIATSEQDDDSGEASTTTETPRTTTSVVSQEDAGDSESIVAAEARVGSFGVADPDLGPRWEASEIGSSWLLWMEVNGEPISRAALVDDLVAVGFSADEAAEAVESLGLDESFHAYVAAGNAVDCCSLDGLVERLKQDGFEPDVATEQGQLALSDTSPVNSDAPSKAAENAAKEMAAWLAQENVGGAWYSRQRVIEIFVDPTGTFGYGLVEATWAIDVLQIDWSDQALLKLLSVEPFANREEAYRWLLDEGFLEYEAVYSLTSFYGGGF